MTTRFDFVFIKFAEEKMKRQEAEKDNGVEESDALSQASIESEINAQNQVVKDETAIPIELQKKKKARLLKQFTDSDLTCEHGIEKIYESFPSRNNHLSAEERLNRLMNSYKEWGFNLHPGLAFPDLLSRVETFGSRPSVKNAVKRLRDEERSRVS